MTNTNANNKQVGGTHYKQFTGYEPWDVVNAWGLGYLDGTALKYLSRWKHKNGIEDLYKAIHFIEKLIEVETSASSPVPDMEFYTNVLFDGHPEPLDGCGSRLCDVHDVATEAGDPISVPTGELNNITILREDRV